MTFGAIVFKKTIRVANRKFTPLWLLVSGAALEACGGGGSSGTTDLSPSITAVDVALRTSSFDEGVSIGSDDLIFNVDATGPEGHDITFEILSQTDASDRAINLFVINAATGVITFVPDTTLDYETPEGEEIVFSSLTSVVARDSANTYNIEVVAKANDLTSEIVLTSEVVTYTVKITDLPEAAVLVDPNVEPASKIISPPTGVEDSLVIPVAEFLKAFDDDDTDPANQITHLSFDFTANSLPTGVTLQYKGVDSEGVNIIKDITDEANVVDISTRGNIVATIADGTGADKIILSYSAAEGLEGQDVIVDDGDGDVASVASLTFYVNNVPTIVSIDTDVDGATVDSNNAIEIDENTGDDVAIFRITLSDDDDLNGLALRYTLKGVDANLFNVEADSSNANIAIISFRSDDSTASPAAVAFSPDFETSADVGGDNIYDITIVATDVLKFEVRQKLTVTVKDVAETAVVTVRDSNDDVVANLNTPLSIAENVDILTTDLYTFSGNDDDGETVKFRLAVEGSIFQIDADSGVLTFSSSPDFEATGAPTYDVEVIAYSVDGNGAKIASSDVSTIVKIEITDVNEAPVIVDKAFNVGEVKKGIKGTDDGAGTTVSISELLANNRYSDEDIGDTIETITKLEITGISAVGSDGVSITDADSYLTLTYTAQDSAIAVPLGIDSTIDKLQDASILGNIDISIADTVADDVIFEITYKIYDSAGLASNEDTIKFSAVTFLPVQFGDILDASDATVIGNTVSVDENSVIGTVVATVSATAVNSLPIVYSLEDALFAIDSMGEITLKSDGLNFETLSQYSLTVTATASDGDGNTDDPSANFILTVNVGDVNEKPTAIEVSPNSIAEDQAVDAYRDPATPDVDYYLVGTVFVDDVDDPVTFNNPLVVRGTDSSNFEIVDGKLYLTTVPDFETRPTLGYSISIVANESVTGLEFIAPITIQITDVNEDPFFILPDGLPADSSIAGSFLIGVDPDSTVILTVSADDPDADDVVLTYSISAVTKDDGVDVTGDAVFEISTGGELSFSSTSAPTVGEYVVTITATDSGDLDDTIVTYVSAVTEIAKHQVTFAPIGTDSISFLDLVDFAPAIADEAATHITFTDWDTTQVTLFTLLDSNDQTISSGTPVAIQTDSELKITNSSSSYVKDSLIRYFVNYDGGSSRAVVLGIDIDGTQPVIDREDDITLDAVDDPVDGSSGVVYLTDVGGNDYVTIPPSSPILLASYKATDDDNDPAITYKLYYQIDSGDYVEILSTDTLFGFAVDDPNDLNDVVLKSGAVLSLDMVTNPNLIVNARGTHYKIVVAAFDSVTVDYDVSEISENSRASFEVYLTKNDPYFGDTEISLDENTVLFQLYTATPIIYPGATITYSIKDAGLSDDGSLFLIDQNTGLLTFLDVIVDEAIVGFTPDFETKSQYTLTVTASYTYNDGTTDQTITREQELTINVENVNEAPEFKSTKTAVTISTPIPGPILIGDLIALFVDQDKVESDSISGEIVRINFGNLANIELEYNGDFIVASTNDKFFVIDEDVTEINVRHFGFAVTPPVISYTVEDKVGSKSEQAVIAFENIVDFLPKIIAPVGEPYHITISEHYADGRSPVFTSGMSGVVGTLVTVVATDDDDDDDAITYRISSQFDTLTPSDPVSLFEIDSATGALTIKVGELLFDDPDSTDGEEYSITIIATSDGQNSEALELIVDVTYLPEFVVDVENVVVALSAIVDQTILFTLDTIVRSQDIDSYPDFEYSITSQKDGLDVDLFEVSTGGASGTDPIVVTLQAGATLDDYDANGVNTYTITVVALGWDSSTGGTSATGIVGDPLEFTLTVRENLEVNADVTNLRYKKELGDAKVNHTYTLTGNNDDLFSVAKKSGKTVLVYNIDNIDNLPATGTYQLTLEERVAGVDGVDGDLVETLLFTASIVSVGASANYADGDILSITEGTSLVVGDIIIQTPDGSIADEAAGAVEYYFIGDGDGDRQFFNIDSDTGEITFKTAPDYENPFKTFELADGETSAEALVRLNTLNTYNITVGAKTSDDSPFYGSIVVRELVVEVTDDSTDGAFLLQDRGISSGVTVSYKPSDNIESEIQVIGIGGMHTAGTTDLSYRFIPAGTIILPILGAGFTIDAGNHPFEISSDGNLVIKNVDPTLNDNGDATDEGGVIVDEIRQVYQVTIIDDADASNFYIFNIKLSPFDIDALFAAETTTTVSFFENPLPTYLIHEFSFDITNLPIPDGYEYIRYDGDLRNGYLKLKEGTELYLRYDIVADYDLSTSSRPGVYKYDNIVLFKKVGSTITETIKTPLLSIIIKDAPIVKPQDLTLGLDFEGLGENSVTSLDLKTVFPLALLEADGYAEYTVTYAIADENPQNLKDIFTITGDGTDRLSITNSDASVSITNSDASVESEVTVSAIAGMHTDAQSNLLQEYRFIPAGTIILPALGSGVFTITTVFDITVDPLNPVDAISNHPFEISSDGNLVIANVDSALNYGDDAVVEGGVEVIEIKQVYAVTITDDDVTSPTSYTFNIKLLPFDFDYETSLIPIEHSVGLTGYSDGYLKHINTVNITLDLTGTITDLPGEERAKTNLSIHLGDDTDEIVFVSSSSTTIYVFSFPSVNAFYVAKAVKESDSELSSPSTIYTYTISDAKNNFVIDSNTGGVTAVITATPANDDTFTVTATATDGSTQDFTVTVSRDEGNHPDDLDPQYFIHKGYTDIYAVENEATTSLLYKIYNDTAHVASYVLTGVDALLFDISDATGELTFKSSPDYENPANTNNIYAVTINASVDVNDDGSFDGSADYSQKPISLNIHIVDVDEAPVLDEADFLFVIGRDDYSSPFGVFTASDEDVTDDVITYSITGDDALLLFDISATGELTFKTQPVVDELIFKAQPVAGELAGQVKASSTGSSGIEQSDVIDFTVKVIDGSSLSTGSGGSTSFEASDGESDIIELIPVDYWAS